MTAQRRINALLSDSVFEMFSMKGKTTILTGASGGIGREVARALAEAGSDIALWYYQHDVAIHDAKELSSKYGVRAKAYEVDVRLWEEVKEATRQVFEEFGHIDVMIANAGIAGRGDSLTYDLSTWRDIFAVDVDGVYHCARAAGHYFKQQGHGNLVTTASMSASIVNTPQGQSCYNAAKAAVLHLTKSLAVEWAGFARANAVSPGYVDTGISDDVEPEIRETWFAQTPMRRDGDPREMKGIYLYLASDASSYATGADFVVDGGYSAP